jgi:hypothetical protein
MAKHVYFKKKKPKYEPQSRIVISLNKYAPMVHSCLSHKLEKEAWKTLLAFTVYTCNHLGHTMLCSVQRALQKRPMGCFNVISMTTVAKMTFHSIQAFKVKACWNI